MNTLKQAKSRLVLNQPFFASLLLRLEEIPDKSIPTMATDGKYLKYNPEFVLKLTPEELTGVLCHEVLHCACKHHVRSHDKVKFYSETQVQAGNLGAIYDPKKRDGRFGKAFKVWNMAADYTVNEIIHGTNLTLPKDHLYNPAFKGMNTEQIFDILMDQMGKGDGGDDNEGEGDGDGEGQSQSQGQGQGDGDNPDPGGCGMVDPAPQSAADRRQESQKWDVATQQAAAYAKAQGSLPGVIQRMVDELLAPKVNWREQLQRFVAEVQKNDYSWAQPNKNYVQQGVYLPQLESRTLGHIAIAIDTSGSIDQVALNRFAAELYGITSDFPDTKLTVIQCDAAVQAIDEVELGDKLIKDAPGGGGTDFRPAFEEADKLDDIRALIYLTDGYCNSFPAITPEYTVMWGVDNDDVPDSNFPFGEVLRIAELKDKPA